MKSSETNRIADEKANQLKKKSTAKKQPTLLRSKTMSNKLAQKFSDNDVSIHPKGYGEPISNDQKTKNVIIVNQQLPTVTPITFTTNPVQMVCPYCLQNIVSNVEKNFNCLTCLFYLFISALCAIPILICNGICNSGGLNFGYCNCDCDCCCDAEHFCPNCGKIIGSHNSCPAGW